MIKHFFNKDKNLQLDPDVASQMLSNVFDACEYEPNSVPLDILTSYSHYRRERSTLQKCILVLIIAFFFLLPVLFISPDYQIDTIADTSSGNPVYEIKTDNLLPVEQITATMAGEYVPVYEVAENTYNIHPTKNGLMDVTIRLINKQYSTHTIEVDGVDTEIPQLVNSALEDDQITIFFSDNSGELDFGAIYATNLNGTISYPTAYNTKELSVTFPYPDASMNIFVPDKRGNTLQLILTVK